MRRIVVETETANKFIEDIEALAAKNDLNIELNMDELGVYVGFASLLKAEIADIDMPEVPAKSKGRGGRTKEPKDVYKRQVLKIMNLHITARNGME